VLVHPVESSEALESIKNNVVFQLMLNKFFDCKATPLMLPTGLSVGIRNYMIYNGNMAITNCLPPGLVVTADVASGVDTTEGDSADKLDGSVGDICKSIKNLKVKKSSCAMCGATRSETGGKLSTCSKCNSVAYCCRHHQVLHWKNGHKQECAKSEK